MNENELQGELKRTLNASRRNTQDKDNLRQFFAMGILVRYPNIDDLTIEKVVTHPHMLL